jgi:hypothetical protein
MAKITIDASELVIFKGIAKNGKNAGKPYAFVKIDRKLSNSATFVDAVHKAGGKLIGGAQSSESSFSVQE